MDGVYAERTRWNHAVPSVPAPRDEDIARLARAVCRKVTRYVGQISGEDKDQQLTSTIWPMPPCKAWSRLVRAEVAAYCVWEVPARMPRPRFIGKRCAEVAGFNVHANVRVRANDRGGSNTCAATWPGRRLPTIVYKNCPTVGSLCASSSLASGTTHIVFTPHELNREADPVDSPPSLPPRPIPRHSRPCGQGSRQGGADTAAPPAPDAASAEAAGADEAGTSESREIDITKIQRGSRLPWALLLKRVFMTDALTCRGAMGA